MIFKWIIWLKFYVKLPLRSIVIPYAHEDSIVYGIKRYRFINADGSKDKRYALNFKLTYPTIIQVRWFRIYLWDLKRALQIKHELEPYMRLKVSDVAFYGDVQEDLWEYFHGKRVLFVRHIAKLFEMYGWYGEFTYSRRYDILIDYYKSRYAVKCLYQNRPVEVEQLVALAPTDRKRIIVTNSTFSRKAFDYGLRHEFKLIDGRHINRCFKEDMIVFMERL